MHVTRHLEWGARAGYAARGVVYLIVGVLAVLAAIGTGQTEDTEGALRELFGRPFGGVLLGIVGLGLLFFACWRFVQAIGDPDGLGTGAKCILIRVGLFGSGLIHLALAVFAAGLLFSIGGSGGGDPTSGWLRWLFGNEIGRYIALALALVPIGIGIAHIAKGWNAGYEKYIRADRDTMRFVKPISSFGLIARGLTFIVIGILAFYGGGIYDADDAPGLQDALAWIQGLPAGWLAILVVAVGLLAFSAYCFIEARYRRIGIERASF